MKILHCVESYSPSVGGMQAVVKQLSERLVKMGHEVYVATGNHPERKFTELNGVKILGFSISGNAVRGIEGHTSDYTNLLLNNDFEIIAFFAAQQWATDLALPILKQIKAKKVSVPTGYSGFYQAEYKGYFEDMKTYIHGYDMNVYLSDDYRDINFARANGIDKLIIIPNGAGEDEFLAPDKISVREILGLPAETLLCLHVGSFTGKKGQMDAIRMFARSKARRSALLLIGNDFVHFKNLYEKSKRTWWDRFLLKLKNNKVIIGYYDREFTVAAYKQSDIFIFPSNIECSPIVLFESAAAATPFLSTDVGNSAEIAKWTGGGEILPTNIDKEGFSNARIGEAVKLLNELIGNETKRRELAASGFKNWREKFSWEKIARQYESLYLSLLKK